MTLIFIVVIIIAFVWGLIFKKQILEMFKHLQEMILKKTMPKEPVSPFSEYSHEQVMRYIKDINGRLFVHADYLAILKRNHYDEVSALLERSRYMKYDFDNKLQEQLAKCSEKILLMVFYSFSEACQKMQHLQLMVLLSKNNIIIGNMLKGIDVVSH